MCALLGMCINLWYFPNVSKIDVLAVDETKQLLLSVFHALYTCLTVRDYTYVKTKTKKKMDPM